MELKERPICTHDIDFSQLDIDALKHCYGLFTDLAKNSFELTITDKFRSITYLKDDWELAASKIKILLSITE